MKRIKKMLPLIVIIFSSLFAHAESPICGGDAILGQWKWEKYIYEGNEYPRGNPELNLVFEFLADGKDRLYWDRTNQPGFCERYGNFIFNGCQLIDQVTWINPENAFGCGADPDMRAGRQAMNRAEIIGDELHLYLSLSGKPFIYVWKRITPQSKK